MTTTRATSAAQTRRVRYITSLDEINGLSTAEREALRPVAGKYAFRLNDYYLNLIDWSDPDDPIRQLVIPRGEELEDYGALDASDEAANTVARGVQHKYADTALLLCNEVCGAYCRYCFRKRLFTAGNDEANNDVSAGLDYIREHPGISNVLLTGGDPLLMSTRRIAQILEALAGIEHVRIVRIGSKMPAFDPWRLRRDDWLQKVLEHHTRQGLRFYLMAHFDHPRELTGEALAELQTWHAAGVTTVNQCPLIRGINDRPEVLAELWNRLSYAGCPPYYLFQGRPTAGNAPYEIPIVAGWRIFQQALRYGSGLARRARFVMSPHGGVLEGPGAARRRRQPARHAPAGGHRGDTSEELDPRRRVRPRGPRARDGQGRRSAEQSRQRRADPRAPRRGRRYLSGPARDRRLPRRRDARPLHRRHRIQQGPAHPGLGGAHRSARDTKRTAGVDIAIHDRQTLRASGDGRSVAIPDPGRLPLDQAMHRLHAATIGLTRQVANDTGTSASDRNIEMLAAGWTAAHTTQAAAAGLHTLQCDEALAAAAATIRNDPGVPPRG